MHLRVAIAALVLSACSSEPEFVYVPVDPPQVELTVSSSAVEAAVGEVVVLSAQRKYRAQWKQIGRKSLKPDQCWVARPPPEFEPQVADNLSWQASVPAVAKFNVSPRGDRAREVVFSAPGTFVLRASSAVWCGPAAGVSASDLTIRVREADPGATKK